VALYPYPAEAPAAEAVAIVVAALRGQPVDYKEAAHAAWQVAGYGLSKWDVHPMLARGDGSLTAGEAAVVLEAAFVRTATEKVAGLPPIPWDVVLPALLNLILSLLTRK